MTDSGSGAKQATGLLASLQRLIATSLEILQTRVGIVATEYEEERERLRELVVYGFLTLFFGTLGLTLATLFVVMLYWETHPLAVVGGIALLYLALALLGAALLYRSLKTRSRLFATTLSELQKDREQLTPK